MSLALIVVFWGRADKATLTKRKQPSQQVKKVMGNFQLDRSSSFLLWVEVSFASSAVTDATKVENGDSLMPFA